MADREVPESSGDGAYPGLAIVREEAFGQDSVRARMLRYRSCGFLYVVNPVGLCGCYLWHETPAEARRIREETESPDAGVGLRRRCVAAVSSLARYLEDHFDAGLALYSAWEGEAGRREPLRREVPPSYFDAPGFAPLPEDLLLSIVARAEFAASRGWDRDEARTHEWVFTND